MRILVCEYVTGGGLAGAPLPPSLVREGGMMLAALIRDLAALPGIEVLTTRDRRLPPPAFPASIHEVGAGDCVWTLWQRLIRDADALWPIAPESDGLLERLSRLAPEAGARLLGCDPEAVRLTASKRATAERLAARGLPVVPSWPATKIGHAEAGWVVKPNRGAGCEDTRLFRRRAELQRWLDRVEEREPYVVQPYLPGPAGSLSLLCANGRAWLLACNTQQVALRDGRFRYLGGTVGGLEARRGSLEGLAGQVAAAIPGLRGYVGVDFVETESGPVLLEVNPRLTTSYVGLHEALGLNPAGLVLALEAQDLASLRRTLAPKPVVFDVGLCHA